MTSAGPQIRIVTSVRIGEGVQVPGTSPGPGVVVIPGDGAGGVELDDLVDVDAPAAQPGLLERYGDGQVRPVSRVAILADHLGDATPHPSYDDLPSLRLLFENGLV